MSTSSAKAGGCRRPARQLPPRRHPLSDAGLPRSFRSPPPDLEQIFAASDEPHIEIGTVYPTKDIRGALYVDALLGKHFALLGSTGTGKSTSAALILHRICELSPEGHIVMVDPHGEYSAAFKSYGELFNVDNLQHALLADELRGALRGASSPRRAPSASATCDILAKCLLAARTKGKDLRQDTGKLTVDSPIPYLLTDLTDPSSTRWASSTRPATPRPTCGSRPRSTSSRPIRATQFMFSGMLVADSMPGLLAKLFRLPARASRSRSSTSRACPPTSSRSSSRCSRALVFDYAIWSRSEVQRPLLLVCEEAHRYIPNGQDLDAARPSARSSSGSPRKAVNMACRSA